MAGYSRLEAVKIVEREKVTAVLGVGWMVREIIKSEGDLSSIQTFGHGGAPSAKELVSELSSRNPNSVSSNGYGSTEFNGAVGA
jgi:long-chain acyl-CoA synthetase